MFCHNLGVQMVALQARAFDLLATCPNHTDEVWKVYDRSVHQQSNRALFVLFMRQCGARIQSSPSTRCTGA
jgi:hypothetical protein